MNNNSPIQETSSDVIFAFLIFLICIFLALFMDPDNFAATMVWTE